LPRLCERAREVEHLQLRQVVQRLREDDVLMIC
jgi:hypothetical protein